MKTVPYRHLQAEVWRLHEEAETAPRRDPVIEAASRAAGETFQERVHARAAQFLAIDGAAISLDRFGSRLRAASSGLIALSFILGLGITRIFPNSDGAAVNVIAVLSALLLPNLVSLFLWILGTVTNSAKSATTAKSGTATMLATGWLGAQCAHAVQFLQGRGPFAASAEAKVWTAYLLRTASGRARLACLTHCLWLALLLGSLSGCWTWFAFKQVDFQWGSTVLAESTVETALARITRPIGLLGITVPSAQEVALSRLGQTEPLPATTRQRWGYFMLAALAIYGLLPRALVAIFTWSLMRAHEKRLQIDEAQPGYARLRTFLMSRPAGAIVDADTPPPSVGSKSPRNIRPVSPRPPPVAAWLALERASSPTLEPLQNLGVIADRDTQRRALDIVHASRTWPALMAQAALITTPDRGLERFLTALTAAAHCPLYLQLVETPEAREWSPEVRAQRIEDWTALALKAGLPTANVLTPTTP